MTDETTPTLEDGREVVTDAMAAQDHDGQAEGQTEDAQVTEGAAEQPETEEEKQRKETARERRERAKAAQARLREEAEASTQRANELERRLQAIREAGNRPAPTREQFADPSEYAAARAVWQFQQEAAQQSQQGYEREADTARQQAEQAEQYSRQIAEQNWSEQWSEGRERYADFDQVALTSPISDAVAEMVKGSDIAADLAYHLGKNPDVARQISLFAAVQPHEAARQIAFIEAQLRTSPQARPTPRTESKAPPPINPGKATGSGAKSPDKMTADEYRAWRESGGKL